MAQSCNFSAMENHGVYLFACPLTNPTQNHRLISLPHQSFDYVNEATSVPVAQSEPET